MRQTSKRESEKKLFSVRILVAFVLLVKGITMLHVFLFLIIIIYRNNFRTQHTVYVKWIWR